MNCHCQLNNSETEINENKNEINSSSKQSEKEIEKGVHANAWTQWN